MPLRACDVQLLAAHVRTRKRLEFFNIQALTGAALRDLHQAGFLQQQRAPLRQFSVPDPQRILPLSAVSEAGATPSKLGETLSFTVRLRRTVEMTNSSSPVTTYGSPAHPSVKNGTEQGEAVDCAQRDHHDSKLLRSLNTRGVHYLPTTVSSFVTTAAVHLSNMHFTSTEQMDSAQPFGVSNR